MPEEADHGLFAYAAEDLPYDLANQLVTVEPGQATARCKFSASLVGVRNVSHTR